jgi:hypothetical protein
MALSSPGVEVKVIDESFYTPAEPGTVPMIVVASAQDKSNSAGDGIAPGTLKANAGRVYLLTSQKDLGDTFGDPLFKTDASNNPIHAGEQNEYGLQAAYSLLGVSNRAFVVRADLDLAELDASASAPSAEPNNGTYWLDVDNTNWGIFEWNGDAATVTGGQTFTNKIPLVITDPTKVNAGTGGPVSSVGKNGSYAVVAVGDDVTEPDLTTVHPMTVWYRNTSGTWVQVGTTAWDNSWTGTVLLSMAPHTSVPQWKTGDLNAPTGSVWIKTTEPNLGARWRAKRYNSTTQLFEQIDAPLYSDPTTALYKLDKSGGGANLAAGQLYVKYNTTETSPQQADFAIYRRKSAAPTSIKSNKVTASTFAGDAGVLTAVTTIAGTSVSAAATYTAVAVATVTGTGASAIATVTKTGVLTTYSSTNTTVTITTGGSGYQSGNTLKILGTDLGGATPANDLTFVVSGESTSYTFDIAYTEQGSAALTNDVTISFTIATPAVANAATVATAINTLLPSGSPIEASVDSQNRLQIVHEQGGDIHLLDGTNGPLAALGFAEYVPSTGNGTANLYLDPDGDHDHVASLWEPLTYSANSNPPTSLTANGTLWYSSVVDEVDIMIHDGNDWVGYLNELPLTDPTGPLVSATKPETQIDGSPLETGDLWVDSSDTENWGTVYRFNKDLLKWFLVDKSDQSTEDGMLFADARYNTAGATSDEPATIEELLSSDFLDFDAPDPALYPKGMLLWNTRRSGFNVKEFRQNYIDVDADNIRNGDESMSLYYPHRWVTVSSNQDDGSGTFGRKAQRKVVVRAIQATVNSNQEIRDEESRVFNLLACPGYPELIGELITLNYDRGLTAFVVGDTPARLTPDATSLLAWGTNQRLALEDNDLGGVSYDEYMGMFYPWGFTSDNFGNNVVVPPSHMILRTIALNDQVAYPWFAPAGVRRGGITNATAVGYVTSEGEFASVALNNGQRDTLYEAKINPITFLTGTGLVNYGQKTRAKAASALDRINVARLVIYLRRQLSALAKPYIFEPNDKITRDQIKSAAESLMLELVGQRALYDYVVVCDESNNTPARIDRNELYLDIAIEPVKAVEFIFIPLRLKNTGEIAALG